MNEIKSENSQQDKHQINQKLIDALISLHNEGIDKEVAEEEKNSGLILNIENRIGDFITFNEGFKEDIDGLISQLNHYVSRTMVKRPYNIFLIAPPGSGKSFLVKQIEKVISPIATAFEEYQISSFYSIENLYGIFRRVQSHNLGNKVPIIFLDEIDTVFQDGKIYTYLLAPMFDGKFYEGGDFANLGKMIFVFAASDVTDWYEEVEPTEQIEYKEYRDMMETKFYELKDGLRKKKNNDKYLDFLDRTDKRIYIPSVNTKFRKSELYKEVIYIAVKLIKKHHLSITIVDFYSLLVIGSELLESDTRRKADQIVFQSQPPENLFLFKHLPETTHVLTDELRKKFINYRFEIIE